MVLSILILNARRALAGAMRAVAPSAEQSYVSRNVNRNNKRTTWHRHVRILLYAQRPAYYQPKRHTQSPTLADRLVQSTNME